jgi:hypothetical protein
MSLSAGTKLGPYEIQSPLGAGGLGEVHRATDTQPSRLDPYQRLQAGKHELWQVLKPKDEAGLRLMILPTDFPHQFVRRVCGAGALARERDQGDGPLQPACACLGYFSTSHPPPPCAPPASACAAASLSGWPHGRPPTQSPPKPASCPPAAHGRKHPCRSGGLRSSSPVHPG